MTDDYQKKLRSEVRKHLKGNNVGYLLGAGSSYLNGEGYPLTFELWDKIKNKVDQKFRKDIQKIIDEKNVGIEATLDQIDIKFQQEAEHRYAVVEAIANYFSELNADKTCHRNFVFTLSNLKSHKITIFSLNYDPLIEEAAELENIRLVDGFSGHSYAFYDPSLFNLRLVGTEASLKGPVYRTTDTQLELIKLHGSIGWFEDDDDGIRRIPIRYPKKSAKRLMIPPQYRKAQETTTPPYATLWSEFRKQLVHGPDKLNRLICVGYGMADQHVNAVLESALVESNFTLVILTKSLSDSAFEQWSKQQRVIIVTENRASIKGQKGPGNPVLSTFEGLVQEMIT